MAVTQVPQQALPIAGRQPRSVETGARVRPDRPADDGLDGRLDAPRRVDRRELGPADRGVHDSPSPASPPYTLADFAWTCVVILAWLTGPAIWLVLALWVLN